MALWTVLTPSTFAILAHSWFTSSALWTCILNIPSNIPSLDDTFTLWMFTSTSSDNFDNIVPNIPTLSIPVNTMDAKKEYCRYSPHYTAMMRSPKLDFNFSPVWQERLCTSTSSFSVTNPNTSSPGSGLQHEETIKFLRKLVSVS